MSSTTPNLGLFKYDTSTDGKEVFSIQTALNNNWDIIDDSINDILTTFVSYDSTTQTLIIGVQPTEPEVEG